MAEITGISWTDHTFNIVWGCVKVSTECDGCYAAAIAKWRGYGWGPSAERRILGASYWKQPLRWNRQAGEEGVRRRVFCSSMADVFETHPQVAQERLKLWPLIEGTPNLDWLLLTKRPESINAMIPKQWVPGLPKNVWVGTTVGHQSSARRINDLLQVKAGVRFLSCEPLLGSIDLSGVPLGQIHWVIVGGESGHHARPMDEAWARSLRDQCKAAGIKFFMKQMGGHPDARKKLEDLPVDLRIREFPDQAVTRSRLAA